MINRTQGHQRGATASYLAIAIVLAAGLGGRSAAQEAGVQEWRFDVASVKLTPAAAQSQTAGCRGGPGSPEPGQLECSNFPLKALVVFAYGVQPRQVIGPGWIESTPFDVVAKVPAGVTRDQMKLMLRTLLSERLGGRVHHESRPIPTYFLVAAKNGPKMTQGDEPPARPGFPTMGMGSAVGLQADGRYHVKGDRLPMVELAKILTTIVGQRVVDATELKGYFVFDLQFFPEEQAASTASAATTQPPDNTAAGPNGPTIFAALQEQLGLKLEARKAADDFIVVDHAERSPVEN